MIRLGGADTMSRSRLGLLVAGVLVLAMVPFLKPPVYFLHVGFVIFLYGTLAVSWSILGGLAGYVSFGQVAFFGVGAYGAAIMLRDTSVAPWVAVLCGGVLASVAAALLGAPFLRLRAEYFGIATLSLIFVLQLVALNVEYTGGATGIWMKVPPVSIDRLKLLFFESMLGILVGTQVAAAWIAASKLGYGLRCIREDEEVAEIVGVRVFRLKMAAWVISSFFIGIGGGVYALYTSYIDPPSVFDVALTINMILMCLLGGMRWTFGPIIGATLLVLISEVITVVFVSEVKLLIFGGLLMLVVLAFPDGIVSRGSFSRATAAIRPGAISR